MKLNQSYAVLQPQTVEQKNRAQANAIIEMLRSGGVHLFVSEEGTLHFRATRPLTDDEKKTIAQLKPAIVRCLSEPQPPYPNSDGMAPCDYCLAFRDRRCAHGHVVDGWALLRECSEFRFDRAEWEKWQTILWGN
jgi:hypothetical protein